MTRWLLALALAVGGAAAQGADYAFHDAGDGISSAYFDVALGWRWPQGHPGATDESDAIAARVASRVLRVDVTPIVRRWLAGSLPDDGLLLRMQSGPVLEFHARESADMALRPQLLLELADGRKRYLEAVADAALDTTAIKGLGGMSTLILKGSSPLALRFDLTRLHDSAALQSATLILVRSDAQPRVEASVTVAPLAVPRGPAAAPHPPGLAARYPGDQGIAGDPQVWFAEGFDNGSRSREWVAGGAEGDIVARADAAIGPLLAGPALRVTLARKRQLALDMRWRFRPRGPEPDEAYFRYYLLLAPSWLQAADSGKLPGFAGTYGLAGWGGRSWDGFKGWSMRGAYTTTPRPGHPAHGRIPVGSYAYHSRSNRFGEWLGWPLAGTASLIEPGRWVSIEQHLKLNAPGREDGRLRVWIDGRLVQDLDGLRLRDAPDIHIQEVWMDIYHGGTTAASSELQAYIDQIVVARSYIGPLQPR